MICTKTYSIEIDAPREVIWKLLVGRDSFGKWCEPFSPRPLFYEGEWALGQEIKYLTTTKEGLRVGTIGTIDEYVPNSHSRCTFSGVVENGQETRGGDSEWIGTREQYDLTGDSAPYTLTVVGDFTDDMVDFFDDTWPKALQALKALAESAS